MSQIFEGSVLDSEGKVRISGAEVRLYDKSTGALVDTTTSDSDGRWSISVSEAVESPWRYFAIAYTDEFDAGIVDIEKVYHILNFLIVDEIVDSNVDLIKIDLPNIQDITIRKLVVHTMQNVPGNGSIEIRNAADGGGSGFSVNITAGNNRFEGTGDLTTSDYFYIRSVTPCGLNNVVFSVYYENPLLLSPY